MSSVYRAQKLKRNVNHQKGFLSFHCVLQKTYLHHFQHTSASDNNDIMDDTFVEFDIEWDSDTNVELEIVIVSSNLPRLVPSIVEKGLAKLFTLTVGAECQYYTVCTAVRMRSRHLLSAHGNIS